MALSTALAAKKLLPDSLWQRTGPLFERADAILFSNNPETLAQRMSLFAFAIRVISAAIAFISQVFLARWMGEFEYGIFVLVWTTMVILGSLSCLGFGMSVIRFLPEYFEKNQFGLLHGILQTSQSFVVIFSTIIAILGALGIYLFAPYLQNYYIVPFYLGLVTLPMITWGDLLNGVARGRGWMIAALSPTYLARPLLILLIMVVAHAMDYVANAQNAILAAIAATWLTTIGAFVWVRLKNKTTLPVAKAEFKFRYWLAVALPLFLVEGFYFLLTNADVLMVGFFMDPEHVAIYFAAAKCLALIHFVYFAVRAGVAQRYSSLYHGGATKEEFARFAQSTIHWTFWPSLVMAAIMLLFGKTILGFFGPAFVEGYPLLFILTAGIVARAAFGPCESLLTMSGNERICVWVFSAALATNIVLNCLLIPIYGLTGAAIATAAAVAVEASLLCLTVYKRLGILMLLIPFKGKS